jgi:hypothetical protein
MIGDDQRRYGLTLAGRKRVTRLNCNERPAYLAASNEMMKVGLSSLQEMLLARP